MKKAMVDVAYDMLDAKGSESVFPDIWKEVCKELAFTEAQMEDNIAQLFSDLSLDDRFINIKGNQWDLKKRHKLHERSISTVDLDDDEDDIIFEEVEIDIYKGEDSFD